jgi:hypothetical protein
MTGGPEPVILNGTIDKERKTGNASILFTHIIFVTESQRGELG